MARWSKGEQTVDFLLSRGRLERISASGPGELAGTLISRASRRVQGNSSPPDRFS